MLYKYSILLIFIWRYHSIQIYDYNWPKHSKIRCMKSFLIINFEHILFALCLYLLNRFVFHLVNTLIQRIFCKITLSSRNTLSTTTFNLQITVVNDIDIGRTHVYCLWILIHFFLASLAEHRIFFLQRDQFRKH